MPRRLGDGGSVVAEFAVALPAIVLVLMLGIGSLTASARLVRLQDAAADAARLAGRGEIQARVEGIVAAAVAGSHAVVDRRGDLVCVIASAPTVLGLTLSAASCALDGGV